MKIIQEKSVLVIWLRDWLDSSAVVIQSLSQADTFSLLCYQSRAYGSVQSPRPLCLRGEAYGHPGLDMGNR